MDPGTADGRRLRRSANVDAVIDAVLDLIAEGQLRPGAAEIAERSGVSLRSVFRYFDDLDALATLALARHAVRVEHLFVPLPASGTRQQRINRFIAHRLQQHDAVAPYARAAQIRAPFMPVVREGFVGRRMQMRMQVERVFAPELESVDPADARELVDAIEVVSGFEALEMYRIERGRSRTATARILGQALDRLLPLTPARRPRRSDDDGRDVGSDVGGDPTDQVAVTS